jgi:hypothetical protein
MFRNNVSPVDLLSFPAFVFLYGIISGVGRGNRFYGGFYLHRIFFSSTIGVYFTEIVLLSKETCNQGRIPLEKYYL